jgi:hypothetical protein
MIPFFKNSTTSPLYERLPTCHLLIHKIIKNTKLNKNYDKKKLCKKHNKEMKNSYLNGLLYFGS